MVPAEPGDSGTAEGLFSKEGLCACGELLLSGATTFDSSGVPTSPLELLWPSREWSASRTGTHFSNGSSGGPMCPQEMLGLSDPWPDCPCGAPSLCGTDHFAWPEREGPCTSPFVPGPCSFPAVPGRVSLPALLPPASSPRFLFHGGVSSSCWAISFALPRNAAVPDWTGACFPRGHVSTGSADDFCGPGHCLAAFLL